MGAKFDSDSGHGEELTRRRRTAKGVTTTRDDQRRAKHIGDLVARLNGEDRVAFRYTENLNGSRDSISGVLSKNRRVLGVMPHPERAVDAAHGGTDGSRLFSSLVGALERA